MAAVTPSREASATPVEPTVAAGPAAPPAAYATPRALQRFLCLDDFEPAARARLPRPLFGYVSGATETNASLRDNRAAFEEFAFLPRMLVNVSRREQSVELFGTRWASPFPNPPNPNSTHTPYPPHHPHARPPRAHRRRGHQRPPLQERQHRPH
jgi:L-lactate dehydrogenase (cytochrome)